MLPFSTFFPFCAFSSVLCFSFLSFFSLYSSLSFLLYSHLSWLPSLHYLPPSRQLHFALTDLALHTTFDPEGSDTIYDLERKVSEKTCVMPPLDENRFLCGFSHIFAGGYSAGYYSYKWAEVLSADAFGAFEDAGLEDEVKVREMGKLFKDTVLSLGGGMEPSKVFAAFRQRAPTTDALLRHNGLLQG